MSFAESFHVRIDSGTTHEVIARTDLGALIGTYVSLRQRGNDLVGLCPFHSERSPSFHVHPERKFFKCFGCGAGGDAIAFMQRIENIPFPEAVRALAKRAGVELEAEDPRAAGARSEREAIYQANALASSYFHHTLKSDPRADAARAYCKQRGLSAALIDEFKLGYAPGGWDALVGELQRHGADLSVAAKAGLVKEGQRGFYDFYRDRLMIPMQASTGETIAFGGRALGDGEPKYLNTSTTPVYTKGRALFALNVARRAVSKGEPLIVVEGYLDCIALHGAGIAQAVATLGTAFTAEQAIELRKYAQRVLLCFDADAAGSAATAKSVDLLIEHEISPRIVTLPKGEDPDSFVRSRGAAAFRALTEAAQPWIEFKLDLAAARIRSEFAAPSAIAREAERLIHSLPREEWDRWRVYVAKRLELSPDDLRASRLFDGPTPSRGRPAEYSGAATRTTRPRTAERDIIATFLEDPSLVREYTGRIAVERFADPELRELYRALAGVAPWLSQPADVLARLCDDRKTIELIIGLQEEERSTAVRFPDAQDRRAHLDRIVERLAEGDAERRRDALGQRIDALIASGVEVPASVRAEYQATVASVDGQRRKRLGTK